MTCPENTRFFSRRKMFMGTPIAVAALALRNGLAQSPSFRLLGANGNSVRAQPTAIDTAPVGSANILSAPFRPESYGAKLDGKTDDTQAWKLLFADVDAKGFGEVKHPGGVSLIQGGQLKVPQKCTITGVGRYGSVFKRVPSSAGTLLDVTGTSDQNRIFGVTLADLSVEGDASATPGLLIQWMYASEAHTENVRVFGGLGAGFQIVASWDSSWFNCFVNWCGQGGNVRTTNSGPGQEAVVLAGATSYAGIGSSNEGNNNLNFYALRVETFKMGLNIAKCQANAGTANSQIRFTGTKWESTIVTDAMITMSNDTRSVWFDDTYLAMDTAIENIGFIDMVQVLGNADIRFRNTNAWIGHEGAIRSVFYTYPGQPNTCRIDGCSVNGPTPRFSAGSNGGSVILAGGGGNVPFRDVYYINGSSSVITKPTYLQS